MGAILCSECQEGAYTYTEPDRDDWENRRMECNLCGHISSIKMHSENFMAKAEKKPCCMRCKELESEVERLKDELQQLQQHHNEHCTCSNIY